MKSGHVLENECRGSLGMPGVSILINNTICLPEIEKSGGGFLKQKVVVSLWTEQMRGSQEESER